MHTTRLISPRPAALLPTWIGLLALVIGLAALTGCDAESPTEADPSASENVLLQDVDADVAFSDAQWATLSESSSAQALALSADGPSDDWTPGALWTLAADLQETLTEDQKQRLFRADRRALRDARKASRESRGGGLRRAVRQRLKQALTDDQQEQIRALRVDLRASIQSARADLRDGTLTREQFRADVRDLREAFREDARAVLTDEQRARLDDLRAAAEERRDARKATRADVLDLSDAQHEAVAATLDATRADVRALVMERLAGERSKAETRTALRDVWTETRSALEDTLTPSQIEVVRLHRSLLLRARAHVSPAMLQNALSGA